MIWSFSGYRSFQQCPRQWFYKNVLANSRAKDPLRREAYRFSKLEGIPAWRGKIVDATISDVVVPSIRNGRRCSLATAQAAAKRVFEEQRNRRITRQKGEIADEVGTFFELEYGLPLTDEMFAQAWADIDSALTYLYRCESIWPLLEQAQALYAQRPLSFKVSDVTVRSVPDLIVFRSTAPPIILDWKVNARPLRDYWLQLVTGAVALTRCTPHRDWPVKAVQHVPEEMQLLEVQLLAGDVRAHSLAATDVEDLEDLISISAMEMQLASVNGAAQRRSEDYTVAHDPRTCRMCSFAKLCWEAG